MSTPMIKQYEDIRNQYPDALLFFRLGDFYELFEDDAKIASKLLGLTLTSRYKGDGRAQMCGVPYHAADSYISRLTKFGKKVAICEQLSDPKLPGLVKRDVIRVITPGTTFDSAIIDQKVNNFIIGLASKHDRFGLAVADVTTGEFQTAEILSIDTLGSELLRLCPREIVLHSKFNSETKIESLLATFEDISITKHDLLFNPHELLMTHFQVHSLDSFDIEKLPLAVEASGLLLNYLKETQKTDLSHIITLKRYNLSEYMFLDSATFRNLEIFSSFQDRTREGSLIQVLDETVTAMGGRLLRFFITHPLLDVQKILDRLDAVQEYFDSFEKTCALRDLLAKIMDIERIVGKIGCLTANARDLLGLRNSLELLPKIKQLLSDIKSPLLRKALDSIEDFSDIVDILKKSIGDNPPLQLMDGGLIKDGYNQELDDLRTISSDGKTFIRNLQQKEVERTKIPSLKIRYNNVFGYYIEITKSNLKFAPSDYIRKQTLANAERFITPELKEYEEKVLGAEEKIKTLEYALFLKLRERTAEEIPKLKRTAHGLALLDVLAGFSSIARQNKYVQPQVNDGNVIKISKGRHPVVEQKTFSLRFVPNDVCLDNEQFQMNLLTGPNMSGKSTYLRQTALIVLLAQIGSFVPAESAEIGIVDRIFTRVGASDNLAAGQSTFMVEMQEVANILNHATEKSLIILDEVGRGTSTYDGVSIAWALTEYLHDTIKAKTIFATHYHELTPLIEKLSRGKNLCVQVKENKEEGVVFLHKVLDGVIDKSYGIEVAKLAGLPKELTSKAEQILKNFEEGVVERKVRQAVRLHRGIEAEGQRSLFDFVYEEKK